MEEERSLLVGRSLVVEGILQERRANQGIFESCADNRITGHQFFIATSDCEGG